MSEERLQALEDFAAVMASAAGTPWLDQKIVEGVALLTGPAPQAERAARLLAFLARAKQIQGASAPPAPTAAQPPAPQEEQESKRLLIEEGVVDDVSMDRAKSFEQLIVGLGYGAFFALWATLGPKLPRWEAMLSGASMGFSLIVYIAFHVGSMVWMQTWQQKIVDAASSGSTFKERLANYRERVWQRYLGHSGYLKIWRVLFPVQVLFGFVGALALVIEAVRAALP